VDETGKSPWHFIFVQFAVTAIVSRIDVDSVWLIAGGNPECPNAVQIEVAKTRLTIASILKPFTHFIERLGSKRPISVPVTLPNEMNIRILKSGVPVPCAMRSRRVIHSRGYVHDAGVLAALPIPARRCDEPV